MSAKPLLSPHKQKDDFDKTLMRLERKSSSESPLQILETNDIQETGPIIFAH
jgi:hypothetical protein